MNTQLIFEFTTGFLIGCMIGKQIYNRYLKKKLTPQAYQSMITVPATLEGSGALKALYDPADAAIWKAVNEGKISLQTVEAMGMRQPKDVEIPFAILDKRLVLPLFEEFQPSYDLEHRLTGGGFRSCLNQQEYRIKSVVMEPITQKGN
jgi:hypothetical protein